ncbi:MAG: phosphoglycerate dehydrogenase [Flammeovirgaceae bacterium]|nr:phosphoglycerate dehydrogenase [Flammeovirgaceae bacterium]HCX22549.1 phosphoglycerate dehydrogenase [Cytophagales bacterium]
MNTASQKILIVDLMHQSISKMLEDAGFIPDYRPDITPQEVHEIIAEYDGIIVRSKLEMNKELLDKAVNLKFVARAGAGIDKVDYPYLTEKGIKLVNAPEGNRDAVGEHVIGMLLSLFHNLNRGNREVKHGKWDREGNRGMELRGKTVGIFGYGFMGRSVARKLQGFDCRVIAYDKYKSEVDLDWVEKVDLDTFFEETEILSIHVPLTSETKFLFDLDYLKRFKNLRLIINSSRGEVLKLSAVNALLADGTLIGAALDVLENEKINKLSPEEQLEFDKLANNLQVMLSPHVAGWTFESYERINEVLVSKLVKEGLAQVR